MTSSAARNVSQKGETLPWKEESRKYRRTVYDFQAWTQHRSSQRFFQAVRTMLRSRMVISLMWPLSWVALVSSLHGLYQTARKVGLLPGWAPSVLLPDPQPFVLTSFALSLLLVFRTNAAYDRWWEARKLWGGLVNRTRDITRQAATFFPRERCDAKEAFGRWVIAYVASLVCHLRGPRELDCQRILEEVLEPDELGLLLSVSHRPNLALQVLSELVDSYPEIDAMRATQIHHNITFFHDATGKCERILSTPIPLSFTRQTSRYLLIWLTFLPLGLWPSLGWSLVPVVLLLAMLLLGIEEIGIEIEEPFGILALEALCERISTDVRAHLRYDAAVKAHVAQKLDASPDAALPRKAGLPDADSAPAAAATAAAVRDAQPMQPIGSLPRHVHSSGFQTSLRPCAEELGGGDAPRPEAAGWDSTLTAWLLPQQAGGECEPGDEVSAHIPAIVDCKWQPRQLSGAAASTLAPRPRGYRATWAG